MQSDGSHGSSPPQNPPSLDARYAAILHDLINTYHEQISEVLSPLVAETLRATAADRIVEKLWKNTDTNQLMQNIKEFVAEWGGELLIEDSEDSVHCRLDCPLARVFHPLLRTPFCPLSIVVLGAIRRRQRGAKLTSLELTDHGAKFRVGLPEGSEAK